MVIAMQHSNVVTTCKIKINIYLFLKEAIDVIKKTLYSFNYIRK